MIDAIENDLIIAEELDKRFSRLNDYQLTILILYLYGWTQLEIADMFQCRKQNISHHLNESYKRLGVYYRMKR